jgi:predicted O-methyltransferase YrrM
MMNQLKRLVPLRVRRLRPELVALGRRVRWRAGRLPGVRLQDITGWPEPRRYMQFIADDISMPPYTGSSLDDFDTLMTLVQWLRPRTVLELGTAYGNTVANICRLLPSVHVYTVNALAGRQSGTLTTFHLDETEIGRVYRQYGYQDQVTQILEDTMRLDLADYLAGPEIDLAIIDACHDTEFVIHDFLMVLPFMRPEGTVLLHDTHPSMRRHYHTSYRACILLRRQGHDIRHLVNTSWAIWIHGWPEPGHI